MNFKTIKEIEECVAFALLSMRNKQGEAVPVPGLKRYIAYISNDLARQLLPKQARPVPETRVSVRLASGGKEECSV